MVKNNSDKTSKRLFLALEIPPDLKRLFKPTHQPKGVSWVHPKQMHLTLLFLGDTRPEVCRYIRDTIQTARFTSFPLRFSDTGFFPSERKPSVFWMGLDESDPLNDLHHGLWEAMRTLEMPVGKAAFQPHVTLARIKQRLNPEDMALLASSVRKLKGKRFTVDRFHLFSSELHPKGAVHTIVDTVKATGHWE